MPRYLLLRVSINLPARQFPVAVEISRGLEHCLDERVLPRKSFVPRPRNRVFQFLPVYPPGAVQVQRGKFFSRQPSVAVGVSQSVDPLPEAPRPVAHEQRVALDPIVLARHALGMRRELLSDYSAIAFPLQRLERRDAVDARFIQGFAADMSHEAVIVTSDPVINLHESGIGVAPPLAHAVLQRIPREFVDVDVVLGLDFRAKRFERHLRAYREGLSIDDVAAGSTPQNAALITT